MFFFTEKDKQSPEEIMKSYNLIPTDVLDLQNLRGHDEIFREALEFKFSYCGIGKQCSLTHKL